MRKNMARAVYITKARACTTTVIAEELGSKHDPLPRLACDAIGKWIGLWRRSSVCERALLKKAWLEVVAPWLVNPKGLVVTGPLSATFQWVTQAGWSPALPDTWTMKTPEDELFCRIGVCKTEDALILQEYKEAIIVKDWQDAADRYDGRGLQKGIPSTHAANNVLGAFKREEQWDEARSLRSCVLGTAWTAERKAIGGKCERCGNEVEDSWHRYWGCPRSAEVPDPKGYISRSNFLKNHLPQIDAPCLWGRAMLPANMLYSDAPAAKEREQIGDWETVGCQHWVVAYTDGEGFDIKTSLMCQRVGAGAFVCDIKLHNGDLGPHQVKVRTKVAGRQTVPRAEITALLEPLQGLVECQSRCNLLLVLDAESVYNTAKNRQLLDAATQSCNADLWKRWEDNIDKFLGTLVLLHVRSHALDGRPDSELRRQQNVQRRRYAVAAGRERYRLGDENALTAWSERHWPETHMKGNDFADKEASQAQQNAVPSGVFQAEAEKWQANTGLIARRIATIEAHIRRHQAANQVDLQEVPTVPSWNNILRDVRGILHQKGHCVQERNGWFECQVCCIRKRKQHVDFFCKQPCQPRASSEMQEMWPGAQSAYANLSVGTEAQAQSVDNVAPTRQNPQEQESVSPENRPTEESILSGHRIQIPAESVICAMRTPDKLHKRKFEGPGETGQNNDHVDAWADEVIRRVSERRQARKDNEEAARSRYLNGEETQAEEQGEGPSETRPPGSGMIVNSLDDPEGDACDDQEDVELADVNPLDDPEGRALEEEEDLPAVEAKAKRKMPQRVRDRLIRLRAKERAVRQRTMTSLQKRALQWHAFRTVEAVPTHGLSGLGDGHTCFALGPIVFCKVCGGTRSTKGNLLRKACRGWAPAGAKSHINAMMKGRPCSGFYRKLLLLQCTPLRRLSSKTKPIVRCQVPRHLIDDHSEESDDDRGDAQPQRLTLVQTTVYQGAAWGR
jgi:hypothetical protein